MNDIEVDLYGAEQQRLQEILDKGEYTRIEIVVPRFEYWDGKLPQPVISIQSSDSNSETIALTSIVLEHTAEDVLDYSQKARFFKAGLKGTMKRSKSEIISKGDRLKFKKEGE